MIKAGVILLDLSSADQVQHELLLTPEPRNRERLMNALDDINERYGRGTLKLASAGTGGPAWQMEMKQEHRSPNYLADWNALPVARV